jgi:[ribosomal protein S5]-alanine N-acetyltransferase
MIRGENITLRVVQEKDLETLFRYSSDIENRGEFFPMWLPSEAVFKHDFQRHGFWRENRGRLVIVDQADTILGSIWFYQPNSYFDALEIGYILFDRGGRNKGYITEALSLLARYLFETRKTRRLQLTVVVGNLQ